MDSQAYNELKILCNNIGTELLDMCDHLRITDMKDESDPTAIVKHAIGIE